MNPVYTSYNKDILETFLYQQEQMIQLLQAAQHINLNTTKTNISISTLIKLKLGDTFRFVINHNLRHMEQAKKMLTTAYSS
jgi:hypothetical protein